MPFRDLSVRSYKKQIDVYTLLVTPRGSHFIYRVQITTRTRWKFQMKESTSLSSLCIHMFMVGQLILLVLAINSLGIRQIEEVRCYLCSFCL